MISPPAAPAEDRVSKLLRGTGSLLARSRSSWLARAYVQLLTRALPGRELDITDRSGHVQRIDTHDQMGANALVGRYRLPAAVVAQVATGDWVIDCGANIGIITSQLCAAVGGSGAVWACEPVPANVARLEELRARNRLSQLRIIPCAIGADPGTATIGLPPPGRSGWASITKSFGMADHTDVAVDTLDRLAGEGQPPGRLRLVKIDVEGYEFEVLDGATALLRTFHPLIYCEFNDVLLQDRGKSSQELLSRFWDLGYHPTAATAALVAKMPGGVVNLALQHSSSAGLG